MAAGSTKRALQYHLLGLRTVASFPQADRAIPHLSGVSCRNFVPVVGKILEAAEVSKPQDRHPLFRQSSQTVRMYYTRMLSQVSVPSSNGKRAFLVDTLALVRRLEAQGLTEKQSEAITGVITEVLNGSLENVAQTFVSQSDMERKEMLQQTALSKLQSEMKSTQDIHFSTLQRETERLRTDIDKMRSELKYEIDKVTAGQRLDLNLERGRIRDELSKQNSETSNLTNKLDKEIHALKTQLEAAKYEVIKYCIGTIVSVTAVGLGLLRIMM